MKMCINVYFQDLSYKEHHWHEFCFKCFECQKTLVDQPFAPKNDKIFCADCHDNNFAARCDGCEKPFRGGKTVPFTITIFDPVCPLASIIMDICLRCSDYYCNYFSAPAMKWWKDI